MHETQEEPKAYSPETGYELLEELVTYDDLFLESFNAYLSLPAFPLRLHYDRLTGWLQELDGVLLESPSQLEVEPSSPHYGATDEERERALRWLAQERFLPFQRTVLYLEYKLAKLLICPLDENYPVSRYAIRGYSRQSDGTAVSSIPSRLSTRRQSTGVPRHMLLRLPSQTRSTPACLDRFTSMSGQFPIDTFLEFSSVLSLDHSQVVEHLSRLQLRRLLSDSSIESTRGRLKSGWASAGEPVVSPLHLSRAAAPPSSSDQDFIELHISGNCGKPLSGPRKILQFDLDDTCNSKEEQEDLDLSSGFGTAALQQLKEDILGTKAGMDSFKEFLHGTLGIHLLDFWIDCEDVMEQTRRLEATATQKETQLFFFSALRSIQAKYMLMVPPASQEQLGETAGTEETAFAALSRKQYDALRRLRSYWVPRFLIHQQRTRQFRLGPSSGLQREEELFLNTDFLFSCNMVGLLPVMDDQQDTMGHIKRSDDWRMPQQFRKNGRSGIGPNEQLDLPEDPFEKLTTIRFLQALMCDLGDGDGFLHYLTRFEDPEKTHNLLLWRKLKLYKNAWEQPSAQSEVHQIALQIFDTFLASYAESNTGFSFSILEYIQQLKTILSTGSEDLKPSTFEPLIHYVLAVLGGSWLHYLRHDITSFLEYCTPTFHFDTESTENKSHRVKQERAERIMKEREKSWLYDPKGRVRPRKKGRKKAAPKFYHIDQGAEEKPPTPQDIPTPQNEPDLLSNTVILNTFRKAAHKMQDLELERILALLQEVEACQYTAKSKKLLDCTMKFLDICDKPGAGGSNVCLPKELKMRLKEELDQGEISDFSWNEIRRFLYSFVAPAFDQFWDEVSKWLKKHGLQEPSQIEEEHWHKLEPLLQSIAAKVALRRLRSQKAQVGSAAATAQPTREDKASFWQSVKKAAEGWPTIEMLHFLKHLQLHGPPVLESGLHFLLEVQKFKNAHHAWPDMALLKKKVLVIRDCFLTSQIEPQLQVAVDTQRLGRAIRAAEQALQEEIPLPPPSLFDELKNSVFSILLPYWAAFQKCWLKRSPASAQKAPVLRQQLLLQKRRAMFEAHQESPQPLQLPPLQQPKKGLGSRCQDRLTYTFSISQGLTLQYPRTEGSTYSKTSSSMFGNRKRSTGFQFPSFRNVPVLI